MDEELILAHKNLKKLMPYLHLPVQSGSDKILKAMNRKHTAKDYIKIIDKKKVPLITRIISELNFYLKILG